MRVGHRLLEGLLGLVWQINHGRFFAIGVILDA
jgi:hypothetical protein